MAKAVIILGAGASADFGIPTLRGVFTDIAVRRYLARNQWLLDRLNEFFWIPRGQSLATAQNSLTVEEMLTILRDWEREADAGNPELTAAIPQFKRFLNVLIFNALYEGKSSKGGHLNPLIQFAHQHFEHTTWASFNWDCLFEASFWYNSGTTLAERYNPILIVPIENWRGGSRRHTFLKLHGAINWWMINDMLTYLSFGRGGGIEATWRNYENEVPGTGYPVILEPSYYKYQDDTYRILESQWRAFRRSMTAADYILFVGYSLPAADTLARSKITTAFQRNTQARWALIDPSGDICRRYERLLGTTRFKYFPKTLVGFNTALTDNMREAFPGIPEEPERGDRRAPEK